MRVESNATQYRFSTTDGYSVVVRKAVVEQATALARRR